MRQTETLDSRHDLSALFEPRSGAYLSAGIMADFTGALGAIE